LDTSVSRLSRNVRERDTTSLADRPWLTIRCSPLPGDIMVPSGALLRAQ
jgi:hypothetical protein